MKILFVSHSHTQTVITVQLERENPSATDFDFQVHLYNQNGHTEMCTVAHDYEHAAFMHKQICEKSGIMVNM